MNKRRTAFVQNNCKQIVLLCGYDASVRVKNKKNPVETFVIVLSHAGQNTVEASCVDGSDLDNQSIMATHRVHNMPRACWR